MGAAHDIGTQSLPGIVYTPRPDDATPEAAELNVLANVYRFILDCHAKKMAAEPDSCNDAANSEKHRGGESCRAATR
jgi:hypothetical protein